MHVVRFLGAFAAGLLVAAVTPAFAQAQPPVAVPLVGSPAAQQPVAPPRPPMPAPQPPQVTGQPAPPMPEVPVAAMPAAAPRAERKLVLTVADGEVALDAQNVTLREIVAEWQRRTGCQFINADKLPASPMTLQFPAGTPELKAIDSLMRGLGTASNGYGYMVAPPNAQQTDTVCGAVFIVPSSRPTATAPAYAATTPAPIAAPLVMPSPDDEIPPVMPFPPNVQTIQARPGQVTPNIPAQQNPIYPQMPSIPGGTPNANQPPPQPTAPGFAPIAPTAPGAGRIGAPPPPTPNGR
jgi:hypothetical protein